MSEPNRPQPERRRRPLLPRPAWIALVWVLLLGKSIWLTSLIEANTIDIHPYAIWGPSIVAGILLTVFLLRDRLFSA
jgi:hypothetical protein